MTGFWDRFRGTGSRDGGEVFSVRDPADRLRAREDRQTRDEVQREIVAALPVPVLIASRTSNRLLYANAATADLFGVPLDRLAAVDVRDLYGDSNDRAIMLDHITHGDGRVTGLDLRLKRAEGSPFWGLILAGTIVYRGEDAIISTVAIIDRRKKLEERATPSRRRTRSRWGC